MNEKLEEMQETITALTEQREAYLMKCWDESLVEVVKLAVTTTAQRCAQIAGEHSKWGTQAAILREFGLPKK